MQAPEPANNQPGLGKELLNDITVREVVHLSAGGEGLRIHVSNAFGKQPLIIDSVHVAVATMPGSSEVEPETDHSVTFAGESSVKVPPGAEIISDAVLMQAQPLADLALSFHLPSSPPTESSHPTPHATSYMQQGQHTADVVLTKSQTLDRWVQLNEVDVLYRSGGGTIVAFGDSITDGAGSTKDGNDRWPDVLAATLQHSAADRNMAVVNEGISGNHLLTDGLGQNALARFDRDVLAVNGVTAVVLLEGINDVGRLAHAEKLGEKGTPAEHAELVERMEMALQQISWRAHAHGLHIIGATILPFFGSEYSSPTAANEADRVAVNAWIRQSGQFDAVVDLDAVTRDPKDPTRLRPEYDSGDHIHPNPAGYRVVADAVSKILAKIP